MKIDVKLSLAGYIGTNADYQHLVGCLYSQQDCAPNQKQTGKYGIDFLLQAGMQFTTCFPRGSVVQWYLEGDDVHWLRFEASFAPSSFTISACDGEVVIFTLDALIIQ